MNKRGNTRRPQPRSPALLGLVGLTITAGFAALLLLRYINAPVFDRVMLVRTLTLGGFLAGSLVVHIVLRLGGFRHTGLLLSPVLMLLGLGLLMQERLQGLDFTSLTISALSYLSTAGALIAAGLFLAGGRYRLLAPLRWPALWLALGITATVIVLGQRFRGAMFFPGGMTPTELVKPLVVVFLAGWLAKQDAGERGRMRLPGPVALFLPALFWCALMGMLMVQRDLGMVLQLNLLLLLMLYSATGRAWIPLFGLAAAAAAGVALYHMEGHVQARIANWLDPFRAPTGSGWQLLQGLSALYSGGLHGAGLGEGAAHATPVASSDFVYAIVGEELGYLGGLLVIGCFLQFYWGALRTAASVHDPFGRHLVFGMASMIVVQAVLNIGGVTKSLPLTGVPLPFVSHGGTSLVACALAVGILVAVSTDLKSSAAGANARRG